MIETRRPLARTGIGTRLLKKEKYGFPVCIEYEYPGKGTAVEEVRKCLNYAKAALA